MSASASVVLCRLCDPAAAMDQVLQQGTTLGIQTQTLFSFCESAVFLVVTGATEQAGITNNGMGCRSSSIKLLRFRRNNVHVGCEMKNPGLRSRGHGKSGFQAWKAVGGIH